MRRILQVAVLAMSSLAAGAFVLRPSRFAGRVSTHKLEAKKKTTVKKVKPSSSLSGGKGFSSPAPVRERDIIMELHDAVSADGITTAHPMSTQVTRWWRGFL